MLPAMAIAETQDDRFIKAKRAIQHGDWSSFEILKSELIDYPLNPYLEYYQINNTYDTIDENIIQQYINKYPNSPMAAKLRRKWLKDLAQKQEWQKYIQVYTPGMGTLYRCNYLKALEQTGQAAKAYSEIEPIWLTGKSQPDSCDAIFDSWLEQAPNKFQLIWQRFQLALKRYNFGLAKYLIEKMPSSESSEAKEILALYANPYLITKPSYLGSPEVMSYGINRIARRDPNLAIRLWHKLNKKYTFNKEQKQRVVEAIALKLALRKNKKSNVWFRKIIGYKLDPVFQQWMVRSALIHNDWKLVKDAIEGLTPEEQKSEQWQYWYARALLKLGHKAKADKILASLAENRSYYGFLASEKLNNTIIIKNEPLDVSEQEINQVKQLSGFKRAKLLYHLNQMNDARLELYYLVKHANIRQQYIILKLVSEWGWQHQALILSRFADHKDDIIIRFPLAYRNAVTQNAKDRNLNPALVFAIIRQESAFTPHANSPAGAIGLMQLMPQTAYKTSKQFKLKYNGTKDLLEADVNVLFGCAHLKKLQEQFNGHPVLMIAAYNAGRRAVKRWLSQRSHIPTDIWIETIPFKETRNYLKNVIAYYVVYEYRLGLQPKLDDVMKSIW